MNYNFIANILAAVFASLGDHIPQVVTDINTRGKKAPESGGEGAGGTIFTRFYPNWSKILDGDQQSIFEEIYQINIKGGWKRKSLNKINIAGLHTPSKKIKRFRRSSVRSHF